MDPTTSATTEFTWHRNDARDHRLEIRGNYRVHDLNGHRFVLRTGSDLDNEGFLYDVWHCWTATTGWWKPGFATQWEAFDTALHILGLLERPPTDQSNWRNDIDRLPTHTHVATYSPYETFPEPRAVDPDIVLATPHTVDPPGPRYLARLRVTIPADADTSP